MVSGASITSKWAWPMAYTYNSPSTHKSSDEPTVLSLSIYLHRGDVIPFERSTSCSRNNPKPLNREPDNRKTSLKLRPHQQSSLCRASNVCFPHVPFQLHHVPSGFGLLALVRYLAPPLQQRITYIDRRSECLFRSHF